MPPEPPSGSGRPKWGDICDHLYVHDYGLAIGHVVLPYRLGLKLKIVSDRNCLEVIMEINDEMWGKVSKSTGLKIFTLLGGDPTQILGEAWIC